MGCDVSLHSPPAPPAPQTSRCPSFPYASPYFIHPYSHYSPTSLCPYFPSSVPSSKFRIPQVLCLLLLQNLPGVGVPARSSAPSPLHARGLLLARIGLAPPHFRRTLVLR